MKKIESYIKYMIFIMQGEYLSIATIKTLITMYNL